MLEHPDGVNGRPSARQAQPGLAGGAAEDAGRLVQPAVGELRDLEFEIADLPSGRDLASVKDNHWVAPPPRSQNHG